MKNLGLKFSKIPNWKLLLGNILKRSSSKNNILEVLFFIFIFIFGIVWTFFVPPFQKPDEAAHYLRAITVKNLNISCQTNKGEESFLIPTKHFKFVEYAKVGELAFNYEKKISIQEILTADKKASTVEGLTNADQYCHLPALSYTVFIVPILIGEIFDSLLLGFLLSRLIAFLFFFLCIVWAFNLVKKSRLRWIIVFYAFTPMVLHQASAMGYDYMLLAIAPVLFSLNVFFIKNRHIRKKDFFIFLFLILIFLNAKQGYYLISLIYFLIPWGKITKNKKKYLIYSIIIFLSLITITLIVMKINSVSGVSYSEIGPNPRLQIEFLKDFHHVVSLIKNTTLRYGYFYVSSFIGQFGWLDYFFLPFFYSLYMIGLGAVIVYVSKEEIFDRSLWYPFMTLTMLLASIISIFLGFYLLVNEVGLGFVYSVQGRYFLPFLPYLLFVLAFLFRKILKSKNFRVFFFILISLYILFEMFYAIYNRYYRVDACYSSENYNQYSCQKLIVGDINASRME